MDQFYSYNIPPAMTQQPVTRNNNIELNNGRVWFTAVMPLLALYVQSYAICYWLGVLAWVCSVVMWVVSLLLDRRYLDREGYDISGLSPFLALIPPVYMHKRFKMLGVQSTAPIVFVMVFVFSLYANGFTRYAMLKDDSYIQFVETQYWTEIDTVKTALDGSTVEKDIGESLKAYAKTEPKGKMKWTVSKSGYDVTVTATCEEKKFEAGFTFNYDGFGASDTSLQKLKLNGDTYEGKDAAEKLVALLGSQVKEHGSSKADSSSADDSSKEESSETDSSKADSAKSEKSDSKK